MNNIKQLPGIGEHPQSWRTKHSSLVALTFILAGGAGPESGGGERQVR